ncbi:MAG: Uma2 family endonuclease [Planctomycetia bacterium]|nr:Uma2 family endonuclease [Planctomycetia bacterium]
MSTAVSNGITLEEFLALPDDGVYREVIRGELREYRGDENMTRRNKKHTKIEAAIAHLLRTWLDQQPPQTGEVHSGEVGCIIGHDPLTTVGIDVAYFDYDVANDDSSGSSFIDGPPILAVEILSPSDTMEGVSEKIEEYLALGVPLVWVVDPRFRTVEVFRPDAEPELFNVQQSLTADPFLPGFSTPVRAIFE